MAGKEDGYDYRSFVPLDGQPAADAQHTSAAILSEDTREHSTSNQHQHPLLAQDGTLAISASPAHRDDSLGMKPVDPAKGELEAKDKTMYPEAANGAHVSPPSSNNRILSGSVPRDNVASTDSLEESTFGVSTHSKDNKVDEKSPSVQRTAESSADPGIDLVIVFSLPQPGASQQEWQTAEAEYARLKGKISQAGFRIAARPGAKGSHERLILVRGKDSMVYAEAQNEKLTDWLNALKGSAAREQPNRPRDFHQEPLLPAERVRLVEGVLARSLHDPNNETPFPRLKTYFPPHDPEYTSQWISEWSSMNLNIPEEQLGQVKNNFGEGVALYFEFLRYYFMALAFPTFIGVSTWLGGHKFSRLYSTLLVLWSILFVEGWRFRERQLSVRWGTYGLSKHGKVRLDFKPEETIVSEVTGEKIPYSPWYRRESRIAATVPILFGVAAALATLISLIFTSEVIINEVYSGPGRSFLALLPTVAFAGLVPQVVGQWQDAARQLTRWENHPTETSHERSLTLKMFALNAIVSFGALALTAYVYLPFGAFLVPYIVTLIRGRVSTATLAAESLAKPVHFTVSGERLTNTLFALMTTTQAIGAFTETILPYLQRKFAEKKEDGTLTQIKQQPSQLVNRKDGAQSKLNWLERIRSESQLPEFSLFNDYSEMAVQFGHVALFSTAWPLAPLAAFINNFFELRSDAFKLCVNSRRPIPSRTDTIGPWLEVLGFISYLSALTNASLVYLLKPHSPHITYASTKSLSTDVGNDLVGNSTFTGHNPNPNFVSTRVQDSNHDFAAVKSVLLGSLLCALASEHGYRLVRYLVAHLAEMLLWRGSPEEIHLRQSDWKLKYDYVKTRGVAAFEKEIDHLKNENKNQDHGRTSQTHDFWSEEDKGIKEEHEKKSQ